MTYLPDEKAWEFAKKHLDDLIKNAPPELFKEEDLALHSRKVLEWGLIIKPDASYRLQTALYCHDIDRADKNRVKRKPDESYDEYKKRHQERSAAVLKEFLLRIEAHPHLSEDICAMVLYHDIGELVTKNDRLYKDYRILKDADAITFFEIEFPAYIHRCGITDAENKLNFMYKKLTDKAKRRPEVQKLYDECKKLLEIKKKELFN